MGRRGPKPQPTQIKIHRGNPSKENLAARAASEPKPGEASLVAPDHLEGVALEVWNRRAPQLSAMKVFTDADRETLERYCLAYECYRDAYKQVKHMGLSTCIDSGRRVATPEVTAMRGYHADLLQIEREFGLTPSSRSGMKVDHAEEENDLRSFREGTA